MPAHRIYMCTLSIFQASLTSKCKYYPGKDNCRIEFRFITYDKCNLLTSETLIWPDSLGHNLYISFVLYTLNFPIKNTFWFRIVFLPMLFMPSLSHQLQVINKKKKKKKKKKTHKKRIISYYVSNRSNTPLVVVAVGNYIEDSSIMIYYMACRFIEKPRFFTIWVFYGALISVAFK